jgi:SAM-dependent methyltransferase
MNAAATTIDRLHPAAMDAKARSLADLIKTRLACPPTRILIVGCGEHQDADVLAEYFKAEVTSVDVRHHEGSAAGSPAAAPAGAPAQLAFPEHTFDLVYSFHALERVADPRRVLREMHRVLQPRGHYCIGTPNRARWVGYLGSRKASFGQKIGWNLADWNARLHGRFRNDLGSHAGFYRAELEHSLYESFGTAEDITLEYYLAQYPERSGLISALARLGVAQRLFPCLYFLGMRTT